MKKIIKLFVILMMIAISSPAQEMLTTETFKKDGKTYVYRKNPPEMTFEEKEELSKEELIKVLIKTQGTINVKTPKF